MYSPMNWKQKNSYWYISDSRLFFYICISVHRNSRLKESNKMQLYADIYLLLNYSTCFGLPSRSSSGVHKTVVAAFGTDYTVWGARFFKRDQIRTGLGQSVWHSLPQTSHVWRSLLPRYYDLYQRLQLQFYVLLMMGAMDVRNMWSNLAVNKYLHTVTSCWISST